MMTKRQMKPDPIADSCPPIPDPLELFPDPMRRERNDAPGLIPTASIAASVSAQGATAGGASVTMPIERPLTENAPNKTHDVTPTNTKRHTARMCEWCLREFLPRRPHGRFCSGNCRRNAWLERNPEKAAELAAKDKARLRARVIERGGEWVEKVTE